MTFANGRFYVGGTFVSCATNATTDVGCAPLCCPFDYHASGSGPDSPYQAAFQQIRDMCVATNVALNIGWDFGSTCANDLIVCANNTIILNTGCVTGSGGAAGVIVPAGTTKFTIYVAGACNAPSGSTDIWSVDIFCAP